MRLTRLGYGRQKAGARYPGFRNVQSLSLHYEPGPTMSHILSGKLLSARALYNLEIHALTHIQVYARVWLAMREWKRR